MRCRVGRKFELHHRRGRSVADAHQHCLCNIVLLCGWGNHTGDHGWAHSNPFEAKAAGLILPRSIPDPSEHPLLWHGQWVRLGCDGQVHYSDQPA